MNSYRQLVTAGILVLLGCFSLAASAQIPTRAERIMNSGLNPSNCTWRALDIRIWPVPKLETNQPLPLACFRYDFDLTAKPRQAAMTFFPRPGDNYQLHVNGRLLLSTFAMKGVRWGLRNLDLTSSLRAGHNLITLQGPATRYGFTLVAEGMVFGEDGSVMRLMTDKTWRGGWNLPSGWDQPETAPSNLPLVSVPRDVPYRWSTEGYFNPPYYGPIQVAPVGIAQPIFDEEKQVELNITVMNAASLVSGQLSVSSEQKPGITQSGTKNEEQRTALSYDIMDENSRKTLQAGAVILMPEGKLDLAGTLKVGPLPRGAYRFRFGLAAGTNLVERRDYEVAVVGTIAQPTVAGNGIEDGLKLKKIWSMDCTDEPDPKTFVARYAYAKTEKDRDIVSLVTNGPAGTYRTLEKNGAALYFAYRFKVQHLYTPHLAVIEWPDDARRNFQVHIMEGTTTFPDGFFWKIGGWARGEAAVLSDEFHPLSNRMQKLHILYWPNEEDEAVHIFNLGRGQAPVAAAKITVYEILNELPAVKIADAGDRLTGYHTERGPWTMSATHYAGPVGRWFTQGWAVIDHPEFYHDWLITTENMIRHMRFEGNNLYLMGHFMYSSVAYPSTKYSFSQNNYSGGDANRDYVSLILRMFGRNGQSMISGIEYFNTPDLRRASSNTEDQVRQGAPTLFCVGKTGKFATPHGFFGGMNYFHPQVQEGLLTIVGELADLYGSYPAWKGAAFFLSCAMGPLGHAGFKDDPLDWGYEDYTIDLFQKETGVSIPVDPKAPDRFQQRYDWLMANARQRWIDWRCSQFTKLYCALRDRMVRVRPDLNLYLIEAEPLWGMARPGQESTWDCTDAATIKPAVKAFGFDVEALKREPNIVISYFYLSPGTRQAEGVKTRDYIDLLHNDDWQSWWANDGKNGAYIWSGFAEHHMAPGGSASKFAPGEWVFQASDDGSQAYPWLSGDYRNDAFVNVLLRSNPTLMPHTWIDVNDPGSRLQESRQFARAYRSLPNGKYTRLKGSGRDLNLWIETTAARDAVYAYAANAQWWPLEKVTLTFADDVKVHDLIKDQAVKLKHGRWTFPLGPYAVQTFRLANAAPENAVLAAEAKAPPEAASAVEDAIEKASQVVKRARAKESDLRALPGWARVEAMEKVIAECQRLAQTGEVERAYNLATSWKLNGMQNQVVSEALEAMPFLVLGPFGDPQGTQGGGKVKGNVEVTPEYRGMETPYLDEFAASNKFVLRPNWTPDVNRDYQVYPDQSARWQEAVKTYYLSFFGKCHSEPPLWMVAYAYTEVYLPGTDKRAVSLWAGSDHAVWVWANDALVLRYGGQGTHRGGQRPGAPDQNRVNFQLQPGWNRILVKAVQRGESRVYLRLTDAAGKPMDDLKFRVPAATPAAAQPK